MIGVVNVVCVVIGGAVLLPVRYFPVAPCRIARTRGTVGQET